MKTEKAKVTEQIVSEFKPLVYYLAFYRPKGGLWMELTYSLSKSKQSVEEAVDQQQSSIPDYEYKIISFEVKR